MHHRAAIRHGGGVIAHGDKFATAPHEQHFVKHPRREPEAPVERLAQFHLVLRAKLRPQRRVRIFKKRVVERADAVDAKRREIDGGGGGVARCEVGGGGNNLRHAFAETRRFMVHCAHGKHPDSTPAAR